MSLGLIGKKIGMTRVYDENGNAVPVTVIDVSDNVFLQEKTEENDGYRGGSMLRRRGISRSTVASPRRSSASSGSGKARRFPRAAIRECPCSSPGNGWTSSEHRRGRGSKGSTSATGSAVFR
jgi:ribosomal protein L3